MSETILLPFLSSALLAHSPTQQFIHSLSLAYSLSRTHSHSLCHACARTHTHTHTHTHTLVSLCVTWSRTAWRNNLFVELERYLTSQWLPFIERAPWYGNKLVVECLTNLTSLSQKSECSRRSCCCQPWAFANLLDKKFQQNWMVLSYHT